MKLIDKSLLDTVTSGAKESNRLRMNYNFHDSLDAPCQRLLNALEPGTIVPIHRHQHTSETYILLRGKLRMMFYNDDKEIIEETILSSESANYGIHIPAGVWHAMEVLASGTVIFETKDGPYMPIQECDILK
ncbi:MAG: WbuC family cupin fold metalloprotein [Prevotella sp.]|nr:WbuC family cupin fold metalloprotein [Prevotella sp.]